MDQQQRSNFKHYCRVCKKGFLCGRALGGHMRAHGIGDESVNVIDDDDHTSDWEEKLPNHKRMYQLRTNPNRLKSCRYCEHCGKEFLSWKSFLDHGKCNSDDGSESLISSRDGEDDDDRGRISRKKRVLRSNFGYMSSNYFPTEEDDILLATCLVHLANTVVEASPTESCASASREEERRNHNSFSPKAKEIVVQNPKGLFECKACKKVFNSHQALGGHRASHKKVKGCYASKLDHGENFAGEDDDITNDDSLQPTVKSKMKKHECSICHRVFPSGQALGGHKRCHWITSNVTENSPKFHFYATKNNDDNEEHRIRIDVSEKLDLNGPAWGHVAGVRRGSGNPLSFEVSTDMNLQIGGSRNGMMNQCHEENNKKNMNLGRLNDDKKGEYSQWLQVGIGSASQAADA